jgi:imidazolonepropionase-like amidohydrolase
MSSLLLISLPTVTLLSELDFSVVLGAACEATNLMASSTSFYDPQNEQRWSKVLQLTKMMYDSRVKILSGTDIPNFELVPGESLHHELELLTEAGIRPMDVIKIAANNGAEALGIINQTGTIEPGKQADILILSANPVDNIENTKRIDSVISNGRIIE